MGEKRVWGASRGNQGSITDPVSELVKQSRADSERRRLERQDGIDELKSEAEKKELEKKISGEDKARMAELEEKNEQLQKQLQEKEIETVRAELGGKIDQLSQSIKEGVDKKSIVDQITELKRAAGELGLGGSKFSEVQEALDMVDKIRPSKGLADQFKDAKELLETFGKKETDHLSPEISLEMKKMDRDLQIRLEEMRDGRADRDRAWQLQIKQWEEERADKNAQIQAEIQTKREANELLSNGIQKLGEVITAAKGAGVGAVAGAVASRVIEAGEGESGETECPGCHGIIPIAEAATSTICPTCGTRYNIERIPKTEEPVGAGRKGKK